MTSDAESPEPGSPTTAELTRLVAAQQMADDYLAALVGAVNAVPEPFSFNVTLLVGGFIVSGYVESGEAWFEAQSKALEDAGHGGLAPIFDLPLEQYRAMRESSAGTPEDDRSADEPTITAYIHLRDVVMRSADGGRFFADGGMRWRCRLSAVAGWMLGSPED